MDLTVIVWGGRVGQCAGVASSSGTTKWANRGGKGRLRLQLVRDGRCSDFFYYHLSSLFSKVFLSLRDGLN